MTLRQKSRPGRRAAATAVPAALALLLGLLPLQPLPAGQTAGPAAPLEQDREPAWEPVAEEDLDADGSLFYASEISSQVFSRMKGKSYKADCPLPLSELRYLHLLHKDKEGKVHTGELVCNRLIADDLLDIFRKLYQASYPIESIRLIDDFQADDETSMRANNTSCFNFRFISHTKVVSAHGLGLAVDINPLYNPYEKMVKGVRYVEPETAGPYTDRTKSFDYKIEEGDLCWRLFTQHGFTWGGSWTGVKDWQHFEKTE